MDIITRIQKLENRSWFYARPCGELDMDSAETLKSVLINGLLKNGCRMLWLDMTDVTFIDSSGLGVILGRYRELKPAGGKIVITGANEQIHRLLIAAGLHRIIKIEKAQPHEEVR